MKKRLLLSFILIFYTAILIQVIVFKNLPNIRIGHLMFNFGGAESGHPPNFVPFKTISYYLFGKMGLIIAGINLIGNIALLVPIGFLVPFIYRKMTWPKTLLLAVASGLTLEMLQTVLRVGIFDIDDVILNALGVILGYLTYAIVTSLTERLR